MNLPRHTISSHSSPPVFVNAQFVNVNDGASSLSLQQDHPRGERKKSNKDAQSHDERSNLGVKDGQGGNISMFACATRQGFFIARTHPLLIVSRREFPSIQGGLSHVSLVDNTSLLILVGGGRVPRFAPNKVVLWDEAATRMLRIPQAERGREASTSFDEISPKASTVFSVGQEEKLAIDAARSVTLSDAGSENIAEKADMIELDDIDLQSSIQRSDLEDRIVEEASSPDENETTSTLPVSPTSTSAKSSRIPKSSQEADLHSSCSSSQWTSNKHESAQYTTSKGKEIAELEFGETVKGICVKTFDMMNSDNKEASKATVMVVILDSKAIIFEMGVHVQYEAQVTSLNSMNEPSWGIRQRLVIEIQAGLEKGLATMAPVPDSNCVLVALPGRQTGHVQILSIALSNAGRTSIRSSIAGASAIIAAHANPISSLTLSIDGRILCTTSERGTLLRLWSTLTLSCKDRSVTNLSTSLLCELRRGSDSAKIWSVAFSPDSLLVAVGSDKGTIHFFNLRPLHEALNSTISSRSSSPLHPPASPNTTSTLLGKKANRILPTSVQQVANSIPLSLLPQYLKSQWSFTQYKIPLKIFSNSVVEDSPRMSQPLFSTRKRDKRGYSDDHETMSAAIFGKQASLEGGWAGMKGRIDDVRRGEKGIEEGLWLTWVPSHSTSLEDIKKKTSTSNTTSSSSTKEMRHALKSCGFELIAISNSGSHYRIGVALPSNHQSYTSPSSIKGKKSTVLNMYKEESSSNKSSIRNTSSDEDDSGKDVDENQDQSCLIEYQRFGMRDDWID